MDNGAITVCRTDRERAHGDFNRLHSEANDADWCYCVAWWANSWSGFAERTSEQNRRLRDELFATGQNDGYLLYVEDEVAAWCQCGRRDRLPKLLETYELEPDPEVFAVTCFLAAKKWRGRGIARRLLRETLEDLTELGVTGVEAYPRRGGRLSEDDAWQGTESLFLGAGFELIRDDDSWPIYQKELTRGAIGAR